MSKKELNLILLSSLEILSYKLLMVSNIIFFLSFDNNSVLPKQNKICPLHKIALYKNDIISSEVVTSLHNNRVLAKGKLFVKYL